MESIARMLLSKGYPIQGYNLYLLAAGQKKKGKTYELLMKVAMLKGLNEIYQLSLERERQLDIICESNQGSVLDALYIGQIARAISTKEKALLIP
ncbi:hypothetical protein OQZ33_17170 [Pedobacter sp. MC2016-05]|uniref:hypothetical protein n=1 Tax=Pedobacter sp. MC2016-05 TaxID=2994474 RepID=UPI002245F481|nr:hypothetical protein [Pedobacter sp. MC2016-05]MCX2476068.1 hypothetical protein [Pedobacter sp. MC2016-05]